MMMASEPGDDVDRLSPTDRKEILERDGHRCRLCGCSESEGHTLHVHHIVDAPDHCHRNDSENLITLCWRCHNWTHKRPTQADLPIEISDEGLEKLLAQDFEILQLLFAEGAMTIDEIRDRITPDHSKLAIRDRLWVIMGLDNTVQSQDTQLIDRDAVTDEWGRPGDISTSERGRIPENVQELVQRIEDEQIRKALDRGIARKTVAEVLDVHPRTTRYKEHRARAYGFPLNAINSRGRTTATTDQSTSEQPGGVGDDIVDERVQSTTNSNESDAPTDTTADEKDGTQRRRMADESDDDGSEDSVADEDDSSPSTDDDSIRAPVELFDDEESLFEPAGGSSESDSIDDGEYKRLLLTVGLNDLKQDAIMRYCIDQQKSLGTVLEEQIQEFANEVLDK
jgi:hypothetical protein